MCGVVCGVGVCGVVFKECGRVGWGGGGGEFRERTPYGFGARNRVQN